MLFLSKHQTARDVIDRALATADELQDFFNEHAAGSVIPIVEVSITADQVALEIGGHMVWLSDENERDELCPSYCLAEYRKYIESLTSYLTAEGGD